VHDLHRQPESVAALHGAHRARRRPRRVRAGEAKPVRPSSSRASTAPLCHPERAQRVEGSALQALLCAPRIPRGGAEELLWRGEPLSRSGSRARRTTPLHPRPTMSLCCCCCTSRRLGRLSAPPRGNTLRTEACRLAGIKNGGLKGSRRILRMHGQQQRPFWGCATKDSTRDRRSLTPWGQTPLTPGAPQTDAVARASFSSAPGKVELR